MEILEDDLYKWRNNSTAAASGLPLSFNASPMDFGALRAMMCSSTNLAALRERVFYGAYRPYSCCQFSFNLQPYLCHSLADD